ncbi:MAG: SDR family NAD(P)-dependent oxidoreductase [bacterium]|nr:SDR family NAD(P)-dependent oxidoreductase [bacterium]
MQGKYVLITGGTGGIGKQTAIGLAKLGAHVIVNGRNQARGEQAVREIQQITGNRNVDLLIGDMAEQEAVHQVAATYQQRYPRLDVLINNAGLMPSTRQLTHDGLESAFAVNVVAPYLLTMLLKDMLSVSRPARVIHVAGGLPIGKIDLENLQSEKKFSVFNTYSHTKRAMLALSLAQVRHFQKEGITVNVAYPGRAETEMTKELQVPAIFKVIGVVTERFTLKGEETVIRAARCSIYLASSPEVEDVSGAFFNPNTKQGRWIKAAQDEATQNHLWSLLEEVTTKTAQPA